MVEYGTVWGVGEEGRRNNSNNLTANKENAFFTLQKKGFIGAAAYQSGNTSSRTITEVKQR